jgi:hypothetical protein
MAKSNNIQKNRLKNIILSLVLLVLVYILGSRALDTGSWWEYSGTLVLIIFGVKFFRLAISKSK